MDSQYIGSADTSSQPDNRAVVHKRIVLRRGWVSQPVGRGNPAPTGKPMDS